jgi:hypothetical protein
MNTLEQCYRAALPFVTTGQIFFVSPTDQGGTRKTVPFGRVFKNVASAYAACVAGQGDTIILLDDGNATGFSRETATLLWNKADTHLVGPAYVTSQAPRASVRSVSTGAYTPLMKVDAPGCSFWNVGFFHGYSTDEDQRCVELTANALRCKFVNVNIQGMGHATPAARAGSTSLYLNACSEVEFNNCVIGLDTVTRAAANAEVLSAGAISRIRFLNCRFDTYGGASGHLFVNIGATADRTIEFLGCAFLNPVNSSATAMTNAGTIGNSVAASLIFGQGCYKVGATNWGPAQTNVFAPNSSGVVAPLA